VDPPPRILVVDDEAEVQAVVCDLLAAGGYHVMAARTCAEALAAVTTTEFDLVITDLRLPDGGGEALLQEIARRQPSLARRLIVLTGDPLAAPGVPVIPKPFDLEGVLRTVAAHLSP
jgi:two-component system response regulator PilR (NtrC family)